MRRPRSADDLDALYMRSRLRLERRRAQWVTTEYPDSINPHRNLRRAARVAEYLEASAIPAPMLVREASALVAAIDALREDEPIPLDVPPHYDGRDGSLEISHDEEDAMIAGEDENMARLAWGDR